MTLTDEDRTLLKQLSKDINRTAYHGGLGRQRAGKYLGLLDRLIDEPSWDCNWPTEHESDCPIKLGGACRCPMGNL